MASEVKWEEYRDRLLTQIEEGESLLNELHTGTMRLQRRKAGRTVWTDYTDIATQRAAEAIATFKAIVAMIEQEHLL
ncbi:hypothetical protein LJN214_006813 [Mesorhizobium sp. LjNodule214]